MKKIIGFLLIFIMSLTLGACQNQEEERIADENQDNRILVAYFSRWGNTEYPDDIDAGTSASIVLEHGERYGTTEYMARRIQEDTGGDLHLIQVAQPYPTDFDEVTDQNHEELDEGTLPELSGGKLDISQYDTVFIGYPVWAANAPQAIFAFLSEYDLSGKTVIPFCTHDGYGAGSSYGEIAQAVPDASRVLDGLDIQASEMPDAAERIARWIGELGLEKDADDSARAEETAITISIEGTVLEGVIYNTALGNEIKEQFPLTVTMTGFGKREYYGSIAFTPGDVAGGQLNFENGDITYCSRNNSMAIFYAQTDDPDLSMEVIPIGQVTSDLGLFEELPGSVDVTFALAE